MFEHLEPFVWSKPTITRLFKAGVAFVVTGAASGTVIVAATFASGSVGIGGAQLVTVEPGPVAGAIVGLVVASLLTVAGMAAAIGSWIAALLNTLQLQDKTWFVVLFALGLLSLGWAAMLAYLVAGPDSTRVTLPGGAWRTSDR